MRIEQRTTSYTIFFTRGKDKQSISIVDVPEEKELVSLIRTTFKGRFKMPPALSYKDGVNIIIRRLDHVNHNVSLVMSTKIFNKSPRQARIEAEKQINIAN